MPTNAEIAVQPVSWMAQVLPEDLHLAIEALIDGTRVWPSRVHAVLLDFVVSQETGNLFLGDEPKAWIENAPGTVPRLATFKSLFVSRWAGDATRRGSALLADVSTTIGIHIVEVMKRVEKELRTGPLWVMNRGIRMLCLGDAVVLQLVDIRHRARTESDPAILEHRATPEDRARLCTLLVPPSGTSDHADLERLVAVLAGWSRIARVCAASLGPNEATYRFQPPDFADLQPIALATH